MNSKSGRKAKPAPKQSTAAPAPAAPAGAPSAKAAAVTANRPANAAAPVDPARRMPSITPQVGPAQPAESAAPKLANGNGIHLEHPTAGTGAHAKPAATVAEAIEAPAGWLEIGLTAIEAALVIAPKKEIRHYLNGALLHRVGADVRLIATDGHRLLAQTLPIDPKVTESKAFKWLDEGVIIPRVLLDRAARALPADVQQQGGGRAFLQFDPVAKRLTFRDSFSEVTLRGVPVDGKFPDYQRVLSAAGASLTTGERTPGEATSFDPKYVGDAMKLAKLYESKSIATYPGDGKDAGIITFAGRANVLYVVMPMRAGGPTLEAGAARLIGAPGLSRTIAALRAHATRHTQAAKASKDEKVKAREKAAADELLQRIADLQAATGKALPAPEPKRPETPDMPKMAPILGTGFKAPAITPPPRN